MFQSFSNSKFLPVTPPWINISIFCLCFLNVFAQNKASIQADQVKLKAEIALTQNHLKSLEKDKSISLSKWNALQKQIASRDALMKNLSQERDMIVADIIGQEADITLLKSQYDQLKLRYKDIVRGFVRTRNTLDPIIFVLSANNIYTAWKRIVYYRSLTKHHQMMLKDISNKSSTLLLRLDELQISRAEKEQTLKEFETQQKELSVAQRSKKNELDRLLKNEAFLRKRLKAHEEQEKKLAALLTSLVDDAIKKSKSTNALPKAAEKLSNAFGANKGKLPWPVAKGYIARKFGKQRHPDLKMIFITNNGIDIITAVDQPITSVFEGTVIAIQSVAGFQKTILVNHGTYYTVYANVENVAVSKGEKIKRGQVLAYAGDFEEQGSLHFELWNVKTLQNPTTWLKSR